MEYLTFHIRGIDTSSILRPTYAKSTGSHEIIEVKQW